MQHHRLANGMKVRTQLKAGGATLVNHGLKVRSTLKAGGATLVNHGLKVKAGLKGGQLSANHGVQIRSR